MVRWLMQAGHNCVAHDTRPDADAMLSAQGAVGTNPLKELSANLTRPHERFASLGEADFANQMLSAMRHTFGGHLEKPAGGTQ